VKLQAVRMAVRRVISNEVTFHLRGKVNHRNYLVSGSQILTSSSKMIGTLFRAVRHRDVYGVFDLKISQCKHLPGHVN